MAKSWAKTPVTERSPTARISGQAAPNKALRALASTMQYGLAQSGEATQGSDARTYR